jgi:CHASE2 domain-containing sensor protein
MKIISLRFGAGSLDTGFEDILVEFSNKSMTEGEKTGILPPAPEMPRSYEEWQLIYEATIAHSRNVRRNNIDRELRARRKENNGRSKIKYSEKNSQEIRDNLERSINFWLASPEFRPVREAIYSFCNRDDEILLIINTKDKMLRKIPWHLWEFFDRHPQAEVILSRSGFTAKNKSLTEPGKVRILAIIGDIKNIPADRDLAILDNIDDVELVELSQPTAQQICDCLREKPGWDILFYVGHGDANSQEGWLNINEDKKLKISDLKSALSNAVDNGLQFAFFASCKGLDLIPQLEEIGLSQTVVMREKVPNQVSVEFLRRFVDSFAQNNSFYLAIHKARERLKDLEPDGYFCASWLPVVFQDPDAKIPTWTELRGEIPPQPVEPIVKQPLLKGSVIELLIFASILILRSLGLFQSLELKAFDWLMRIRPDTGVDPRLLIVEATETDINRLGYPLPDAILAQTIEHIEKHQPHVIGLQIFRDRPVGTGHQELISSLQNNDSLIALCSAKLTDDNPNQPGISSLVQVPQQRLGFSNIELDEPDGILRRQLLFLNSDGDNPCPTEFSFSSQLALQYLNAEGIQPETLDSDRLKIGNTTFKRLQSNSGGYHNLDNRGFQLLLNYRNSEKIAKTVSLTDVLNEGFDPELVKDRVVIIGVVAPISNPTDYFSTPYSKGVLPKMSGVYVQAQMTSQILSAVLDERPLIKTWSQSGEIIWLFFWSLAGSGIAIASVKYRNSYLLPLGTGIGLLVLWGSSYLVLITSGLWLPFVPGAIALFSSSVGGKLLLDNWNKLANLQLVKPKDNS